MRFHLPAAAFILLTPVVTFLAVQPAAAQKIGKPSARYVAESKSPAEIAYAAAFTAIARDYRDSAAAERQHPALASLSLSERRAFIDRRMNEKVNAALAFARRLDALKPPPRFKAMHAAARALFQTEASSMRDFSTAMHTGDRNAANAAWARVERAHQLFSQRCQEAKQASRR